MTYRVEQFVAKIESPVIAVLQGEQREFPNGRALAETAFSRLFRIESLTAQGDRIIITIFFPGHTEMRITQ